MYNCSITVIQLVSDMILNIDTTSSVPVYAQIVEQVRKAAAMGLLKSGDPLPSLRETAIKLRINPLTVSKAYKLLEQEGIIETKHGSGSFIADSSKALSSDYLRKMITDSFSAAIEEAMQAGFSETEITNIFNHELNLQSRRKNNGK